MRALWRVKKRERLMNKITLGTLLVASQATLAAPISTSFFQPQHALLSSGPTAELRLLRSQAWQLLDNPTLFARVSAITFYNQTDRNNGRCNGIGRTLDLSDQPFFDTGVAINGASGALKPIPLYMAGLSNAAKQLHYQLPANGLGCAKLYFEFKAGPALNHLSIQFKPRAFEYSNISSPGNNHIDSGITLFNQYTLKESGFLTLTSSTQPPVDTGILNRSNTVIALNNIGFAQARLSLDQNLPGRGIRTDCSAALDQQQQCHFRYNGTSRGDGAISAIDTFSGKVIYPFHIEKSGQVKCWGRNNAGQLGDGSIEDRSTPASVPHMNDTKQIVSGAQHSCALKTNGDVYCWGDNQLGQLGTGNTEPTNKPLKVQELSNVILLSAGSHHNCALLSSGTVQCWGDDSFGQLGDGHNGIQALPVRVMDLKSPVKALASGSNHSCALLATGSVHCWGANDHGQIGDGTVTTRHTPVAVSNLKNDFDYAVRISAGGNHSCALLQNGSARCWGGNDDGQLGDGSTNMALSPQPLTNHYNNLVNIVAGNKHTCAQTDQGGVLCWGNNSKGQLGTGSAQPSQPTPQWVDGFRYGVVSISATNDSTCAIKSGGKTFCWGGNQYGQLGDNSLTWKNTPSAVVGLRNKAVGVANNSGNGEFNCVIDQ